MCILLSPSGDCYWSPDRYFGPRLLNGPYFLMMLVNTVVLSAVPSSCLVFCCSIGCLGPIYLLIAVLSVFPSNFRVPRLPSFIHLFIAICKAHYVENVESEALEAVARWSVIGKIVSF